MHFTPLSGNTDPGPTSGIGSNTVSGSSNLRNSFTGNGNIRNSFTGNGNLRNSFTGNGNARNSFTGAGKTNSWRGGHSNGPAGIENQNQNQNQNSQIAPIMVKGRLFVDEKEQEKTREKEKKNERSRERGGGIDDVMEVNLNKLIVF